MVDTSAIHAVLAQTRRRIRGQRVLEAIATASILTTVTALLAVYLARRGHLAVPHAYYLLAASMILLLVPALIQAFSRVPDHAVATKLDHTSHLDDRLATACAFEKTLATEKHPPQETVAMMHAAIRDAVGKVSHADVKAASPIRFPKDTRPAIAFILVAAIISGLKVTHSDSLSMRVTGTITLAGEALPDEKNLRGHVIFRNASAETEHPIPLGTDWPPAICANPTSWLLPDFFRCQCHPMYQRTKHNAVHRRHFGTERAHRPGSSTRNPAIPTHLQTN